MKRLLVILLLCLAIGFAVIPGVYAAWDQSITVNGNITVTVPVP